MSPQVTQFKTRRQALERALRHIRHEERACRDGTVPRPHADPSRHKLALLTWASALISGIEAYVAGRRITAASRQNQERAANSTALSHRTTGRSTRSEPRDARLPQRLQ